MRALGATAKPPPARRLLPTAGIRAPNDDGHGIPNEELPSIFEFGFDKRGDRVSMRVGLPRSKQTIDELGGTIEIESTVGAGTSVVVRLPAAPS